LHASHLQLNLTRGTRTTKATVVLSLFTTLVQLKIAGVGKGIEHKASGQSRSRTAKARQDSAHINAVDCSLE